jgi:DNA-directed RNA polymerase subunit RPC12/RpoP
MLSNEHQWKDHTAQKLEEERKKSLPPTTPERLIQYISFECDKCGGKFDTMALLQEHKGKWLAIKCDECFGAIFEDSAALKKHWKAAHILKCLKCGESFFHGLLTSADKHHCLKWEMKGNNTNNDLLGIEEPFTESAVPTLSGKAGLNRSTNPSSSVMKQICGKINGVLTFAGLDHKTRV